MVGPHREIEEQHVYEDIMQLVDWVRDDTPSIVTAEHARHVIEIIDVSLPLGRERSGSGAKDDILIKQVARVDVP